MSHTPESLADFLNDVEALRSQIKEMRKPFLYTPERADPNEWMVSGAFGNILNNLDTIRNHAVQMEESACLRRASNRAPVKQAAE